MNLSCNKAVAMPGSGETLTITCFTCGMPSSKEWAQKIRSRPSNPNKPYYPFILQVHPPLGSGIREDGTTFVCAFCHASLEAQWKNYERQQPNGVPPMNRKYNLYKFICAVCGVETYRKRVRTLPFQEFPFLANQRPAGSLTLGNNPLAIVCLDCSETLWAQSAEYDRWGLPIHKRMFNWMARPPPPEDSVEATVARLPSGETQLPRCPPIEPAIATRAKEAIAYDSLLIASKSKSRNGKTDHISVENETMVPLRKSSFTTSSNSSVEGISAHSHSQPPIVTVAPMSAHNSTSTSALKKDSVTSPRGYSPPFKYDMQTNGIHPSPLGYPIFPRTTIYPTPYGTYPWSARETAGNDRFSYSGMEGMPSNPSWPWIPPPSGVLQYAAASNHVNPYVNRNYANEHVYHSNHMHFTQLPSQHMDVIPSNTVPSRSTSPIVTSALPSSPPDRNGRPEHIYTSSSKSGNRHVSFEDEEPTAKHQSNGKSAYNSCPKKTYKPPQLPDSENSSCSSTTMGDLCGPLDDDEISAVKPAILNKEPHQLRKRSLPTTHLTLNDKDRQRKLSEVASVDQSTNSKQPQTNVPDRAKRHSNGSKHVTPPSAKPKVEIDPVGWPPRSETLQASSAPSSNIPSNGQSKKRKTTPATQVMDLSTPSEKLNGSRNAYSKKFMIAYLCKSDDYESGSSSKNDDPTGRRSVIVAAQKPAEEPPLASRKRTFSNQVGIPKMLVEDQHGEPAQKLRKTMPKHQDERRAIVKNSSNSKDSDTSEEEAQPNTKSDAPIISENSKISKQTISQQDIKEYTNKIVSECKKAVKQEQLLKRKRDAEQESFLQSVGLITKGKKSELELQCLISRSNRHTLLPLKLRPSSPPRSEISQEFKKLLLQTAFDDPSLKTLDIDKEEVTFLAHLDLKPASMGEKQRREQVWRLMLLERMKRGKRNRMIQGIPKPWNCIESITLTRVMSPIPRLCGPFSDSIQNLTVSLPSNESPDRDTSAIDRRPSSDLLAIADSNETGHSELQSAQSLTLSAMCIVQPVISYPKYIPRYVPQLAPTKVQELDSKSDDEFSSKSVNGTTTKPPAVNGDMIHSSPAEPIEKPPSLPSADEDHCILKVPDVSTALKQRESQCDAKDHSATTRVSKPAPALDTPPPTLESILRENSAHNERFLKQLSDLLGNIPTSNSRLEKNSKSWPKTLEDWRTLKAFLKSRQQQIKSIEEKMKKKEKIVCGLFKPNKSVD